MNLEKIKHIMSGQPKYRLQQVYDAVYKKMISDWNDSNLSKELKDALNKDCPLKIKVSKEITLDENKKTIKAQIEFTDGKKVETVLLRHKDGRNTVCVSSQVGCALACDFCATGDMGFIRNLKSSEIIEQVLYFSRLLKEQNDRVTNIVFMGMGEPLLNYENVMDAIKILNDKDVFNIGARKISISTVGIVDGIRKLAKNPLQLNLAISIHAPNDKIRDSIMPINKRFSINQMMRALNYYIEKTNRRVMVEYVLFEDINDSQSNAKELAELLKSHLGKLFFVNLIPCNQIGKKYKPSSGKQIQLFKNVLEKNKISVVQRFRFGKDVKGACGQLSVE